MSDTPFEGLANVHSMLLHCTLHSRKHFGTVGHVDPILAACSMLTQHVHVHSAAHDNDP